MIDDPVLAVVVALGAVRLDAHRVILTKKLIEGMEFYAREWRGRTVVFTNPVAQPTDNLDNVEVEVEKLPFGVEVIAFGSPAMTAKLGQAAVVLGGPIVSLRGLSAACRARGVPCVYNTEYSLTTRVQIVHSSVKNPLRKLRKFVWEVTEEYLHLRNELRLADGVQCNGTPTFEAYKGLTPSPLLYFDNRVNSDEIVSDAELHRANERRSSGGKLRLAFSGRLNAMKGAGDLVPLAAALRDRGVAFELEIFGSGPLEEDMRLRIAHLGLGDQVKMRGVLDFHSELLPRLRETIDLFVCCHAQGDPSCTYLETMSAGVPIAGYANEAFAGLCEQGPVGWSTPLRDVDSLADEIARLAVARHELASRARGAVAFAREHAFERTFRRRVDHLREVAERARREGHGAAAAAAAAVA